MAFTQVLKDASVKFSMGGKGRWMDNVFIEWLWRSLKYECVYLQAFETGSQARTGIGRWIDYYNTLRPHSAFDGRTPEEVYSGRRVISGACPGDDARSAGGMKIIMGSHLTNAGKLSNDWGPPLIDHTNPIYSS